MSNISSLNDVNAPPSPFLLTGTLIGRILRSMKVVSIVFLAYVFSLEKFRVKMGDGMITHGETYIGGGYKGYICELERTMFMGPPSDKQRKIFEIMVKAQDVAFETYSPGVKCSEVDKAVMKVFKDEGVFEYARHHTGHNSGGLEVHEAPYIDVGQDVIMQPNMVFSCEPGLYVPGLGGFRHSDCILITEDGAEVMTYYPRDIDSLTIIP